jgi:hypothetical protein
VKYFKRNEVSVKEVLREVLATLQAGYLKDREIPHFVSQPLLGRFSLFVETLARKLDNLQ